MNSSVDQLRSTLNSIEHSLINFHALALIAGVIAFTYILMRLLSWLSSSILKRIIYYTERSDKDKANKFASAENWLNVAMAVIKLVVVCIALYICWRFVFPASAPAAVVGAGALFVVLAGATIGPLLRDITAGSIMLAERWYGVGDFVNVEPFFDVKGVVEQVTLRSTKLRGLSGEVVWIHNQNIQAVKVKYRGATAIALDVFVSDKQRALKLLEEIISIVPKGQMLVIGGLKINDIEKLNESMWRIELLGKTVPGREWLIEKFALEAILEADAQNPSKEKIIVFGPIARYVDAAAERRFKRAIK